MTSIPTIAQLYTAILADMQTQYGITIPAYGKSFLRALAAVQAAKLKLYYLAIAGLQKNIFVDTAEPEASGGTLERFGRVKIGRNPYPATQGQYQLLIAVEPAGANIASGTVFKSADTATSPGKLYIVDSGSGLSAPSDSIVVRALEGGSGSRLVPGDVLMATIPIPYINSEAPVQVELVAPQDAEAIEDYRAVVVQSYRLYPQGGASADYRLWGAAAAGVKQVYPYAVSGAPGEINVFVEATTAASTDGHGTPTSAILTDVAGRLETDPVTGKGRRPLGVFAVHTLPAVINNISITIAGSAAITAAQQVLVTAALAQAVASVRPFIAGADVLANKNDNFGINNIISTILATLPGISFGAVSMTVAVGGGLPAAVTTKNFDNGNIPWLGTVTYA